VWLGIVLAYDSYYWPPAGHGWPVSFFVVALVFLFYLAAGALTGIAQARRSRRWETAPRLAASGCAEHPGDAA
jgi:zinc/manganese transport system permease protein